ncbi:uncharacterized protein [Coffea arabica]|uniref:RNase H type-1 domain-containing protein n=1 Tax=Coffea arabica TaxID=13443 RepID=A0ABM4VGV3_COFAR
MFAGVWYPLLPVKISFFMMRVLRNRLLVASALGRLNVHGPSKCFCCLDPNSESLEHIFSEGDLAQFLWAFFGNAVGVVYRGTGVRSRLVGWWSLPTRHSRMKMIHTVFPSIICWHIWLAYLVGTESLRRRTICDRIMADAVGLVCEKAEGESEGYSSWHAFYASLSGWRPRYSHRMVCWEPSGQAICKLNTDGCSLGNLGKSGGGGVLRDASGELVFGFSIPLGEVTSLQAEAKSLIYGVQQCVLRGFSSVQVEVDSLLLANILQGKLKCPWLIRSKFETFQANCALARTVGHCYREAN